MTPSSVFSGAASEVSPPSRFSAPPDRGLRAALPTARVATESWSGFKSLMRANVKIGIAVAMLVATTGIMLGGSGGRGPFRAVLVPQAVVAQQPQSQVQHPGFGATLDRVRVDVIVTDAEGHFVADLRPQDFVVYEDGVRQEVRSLQLIDLVARRVTELGPDALLGHDVSGGDVARTGITDEAIQPSAFGAIVYLIDFPGLDHRIKLSFVEAWESLLARTETFNLPQAVYLVDNVGRLREVAPLSMDVEALRQAVREVGETGLTIAPGSAGGGGGPGLGWRARTQFTLELLRQFADALAARPGRTALVWVSVGVSLRNPRSRMYSPHQGMLDLQLEMHHAANTSNVSIYAVDPSRWIDFLGPGFFNMESTAPRALPSADSPPGRADIRAGSGRDDLGNSLRAAAEATGGRAFILQAYLDEVLQTIEEESSRYYLLTYAAPPPNGDGEYHEIRVEVSRPDVEVRSRSGYVDYSGEERRSRFVSAALSQPGTIADLPITVGCEVIGPDGDLVTVETTLHVDARELSVRRTAAGQREVALEVHAAVLDDDLDLIDELHDEQVWIGARAGTAAARTSPDLVTYRHRWRLEPGEYDLRIMAQDPVSGRVGATSVPFTVPKSPRADAFVVLSAPSQRYKQ